MNMAKQPLYFLLLLVIIIGSQVNAQVYSYSVQPSASTGIDANIQSGSPGTNYGSDATMAAERSGGATIRSLIQFDLSSIPSDAIVVSAKLSFYAGSLTGSNDTYLRRITAGWAENTCTWTNMSANSDAATQISVPSTTVTTSYTVDVKSHVQGMINVPATNYGWMFMLQNEAVAGPVTCSWLSSDNVTAPTTFPKLEVTYEKPMQVVAAITAISACSSTDGAIDISVTEGATPYTYSWSTGATTQDITGLAGGMYTVTITDANGLQVKKIFSVGTSCAPVTATYQPDGLAGKDAYIALGDNNVKYLHSPGPAATVFQMARGTASGWFKSRSLIEFDLAHIPVNAVINSASLTLYGNGHNQLGMSNATYLNRVTSAWDENSLTWNLMPAISSTYTISVAATNTTTPNENKIIDVTTHVQDMVANPSGNYGWVMLLQNEVTAAYAAMVFGSSDNSTAALRPKLEINYTIPATLTITQPSTPLCLGATTVLTAPVNTCASYSWSGPGIVSTTANTATVSASGSYSVTTPGCPTATAFVNFIPPSCATPADQVDGGYYNLACDYLYFSWNGEYNKASALLRFNIYNQANTVIASNTLSPGIISTLDIIPGDNRYSINMTSYATGYYVLEVINEKNEKKYLRFKK
jgi:hypothetical protein